MSALMSIFSLLYRSHICMQRWSQTLNPPHTPRLGSDSQYDRARAYPYTHLRSAVGWSCISPHDILPHHDVITGLVLPEGAGDTAKIAQHPLPCGCQQQVLCL